MRAALAAALLAALPASAAAPSRAEGARYMKELMSGRAELRTGFALQDPSGRVRRLEEFRGQVVIVSFGYTTCPDVCPMDLAALGAMMRGLGPLADEVQPVFITLDPARDTAQLIGAYVQAFHPKLLGLRGSPETTSQVARGYKAYYAKVPWPGKAGYAIDHAGLTYVLARDGTFRSFLPPGTNAERMGVMVREALGR